MATSILLVPLYKFCTGTLLPHAPAFSVAFEFDRLSDALMESHHDFNVVSGFPFNVVIT